MSFPEIEFDPRVSEDNQAAVLKYITRFQEGGAPAILSLEHFALMVGLTTETVFGFANSTPSFYRTFRLQKANGGTRRIDAPLPSLLLAQRWVLKNILEKKECHAAAKAYIKGQSIRTNARFHKGQAFVLKADVKDFFGSIREYQIFSIFRDFGYLEPVAIGLSKICCLNGVLPQGGATSGYLSNILLINFDVELLKFCRQNGLRYSRYADDITISGAEIDAARTIEKIKDLLKLYSLRINKNKTRLISQNSRQKVTGVVVNKNLSVEQGYLKDLRQAHYYIMKHGIFGHSRHIGSKNPRETLDSLIGRVAYAQFIRNNDKNLKLIKEDLLEERKNEFGY